VARRPDVDQSSEGDWSVNLKEAAEAPNLTVELETSDLKSLSTEGLISPMTVELSTTDIQYVAPGHTGYTAHEVGRIMGESTSVLVDFGDEPKPSGPTSPRPATPLPPTAALPNLPPKTVVDLSPPNHDLAKLLPPGPVTPRSIAVPTPMAVSTRPQTATDEDEHGGLGLVVIVYLLAAGALGISIYMRWFA